jgi:uncharacterized membrane protein
VTEPLTKSQLTAARDAALAGKGKRVFGVFAILLGASLVLDTHALQLGLPVLVAGVMAFVWGMLESRAREVTSGRRS